MKYFLLQVYYKFIQYTRITPKFSWLILRKWNSHELWMVRMVCVYVYKYVFIVFFVVFETKCKVNSRKKKHLQIFI